jgi:hypothetical protein
LKLKRSSTPRKPGARFLQLRAKHLAGNAFLDALADLPLKEAIVCHQALRVRFAGKDA